MQQKGGGSSLRNGREDKTMCEETLRLLESRKSMRVFENRPVPEEVKQKLLSASLRAASAGNMALYTIIDVTDAELKRKLSVTCDNQPFIADAPLALVYCADYRRWYRAFCGATEEVRHPSYGDFMLAAVDAVIAAQTAATAADALGLGTCYIFQVFLTIGGVTKFIPSTGVTLPLVSYGGSSLVSTLIMFAIIQGLYILREDEEETIERKKKEKLRAARSGQEAPKKRRKAADVPERAQGSGQKRQKEVKRKTGKEQRVR